MVYTKENHKHVKYVSDTDLLLTGALQKMYYLARNHMHVKYISDRDFRLTSALRKMC